MLTTDGATEETATNVTPLWAAAVVIATELSVGATMNAEMVAGAFAGVVETQTAPVERADLSLGQLFFSRHSLNPGRESGFHAQPRPEITASLVLFPAAAPASGAANTFHFPQSVSCKHLAHFIEASVSGVVKTQSYMGIGSPGQCAEHTSVQHP